MKVFEKVPQTDAEALGSIDEPGLDGEILKGLYNIYRLQGMSVREALARTLCDYMNAYLEISGSDRRLQYAEPKNTQEAK